MLAFEVAWRIKGRRRRAKVIRRTVLKEVIITYFLSATGTPFVVDMSHQTPNAKAEIEEITSCLMFNASK